jgi:hypothetical protein
MAMLYMFNVGMYMWVYGVLLCERIFKHPLLENNGRREEEWAPGELFSLVPELNTRRAQDLNHNPVALPGLQNHLHIGQHRVTESLAK